MGELAKVLGTFFARDFLYLLSGSFVTGALLIPITNYSTPELPVYVETAFLLVSYVLGYTLQEVCARLGLVSIDDVAVPGRAFRFCNRSVFNREILDETLFEGHSYETLQRFNRRLWDESTPARRLKQHERFIVLRTISSAVGPSLVFSSVFFVLASVDRPKPPGYAFMLSLYALLLLVGLWHCAQSHFRSAQTAWHLLEYFDSKRKRT
jgi:hypothetical protein